MTVERIPFIGRRDELEVLALALECAGKGEPCLVQIAAEAGFGKTRLVDEALKRPDPSTRIVSASCFEGDRRSYSLLHRLLDQLTAALGRPADASPVTAERADRELTSRIAALCADSPAVLILEDLHWADTVSLEVLLPAAAQLGAVARQSESTHLTVITTYRPFELNDRSRYVLDRLSRLLPRSWTLTPRPLTPVEVNALVVAMGYVRPSGRLLSRMMEACGGNPLHVQTVVTQLDRTDRLLRRGGTTDLLGAEVPIALGGGLTEAIEQRLSLVAGHTADLLAIAAMLDPPVSPRTLAEVAGLDLEAVYNQLSPAVSEHLIDVDAEVMSFHHPLLRTVLPGRFTPVQRSILETRIADVLLPEAAGSALVNAAQHLRRARLTERPERLADVCSRGAVAARDLGDYGATAELAEAALDAARSTSPPSDAGVPGTDGDLARLHLLAAFGHYRFHDRTAWEPHIAAARHGAVASGNSALSGEVELLAARAAMTFGPLPVDEAPLTGLLSRLTGDDPLVGRIHQTLAEIRFGRGEYDPGLAAAEIAVSVAERTGDPADEAKAVFARGLNAWAGMDLDLARASFESCERLSLLSEDRWLTTWGRGRLSLVSHMEGRVDDTMRDTAEHSVRAEAFGDWSELALASALRVAALTFRGEAAEAEEEADRALAISARGDYVWAPTILVPALTCLRAERGDAAGAAAALKRYNALGQRVPRVFQQLVSLTLGDLDAARAQFVPRRLSTGVTALTLTGYCAYGAVAVALGERQCIEWFLDDVAEVADRGVLTPIAWNLLIPRLVGEALAAAGGGHGGANLVEARSWLTRAVERATLAGAIPELGRTWLALAQLHSRPGPMDDRSEALRYVARAVSIARRLGMVPLEREAVAFGLTLGRFDGDAETLLGADDPIGPPLLGAVLFTDVVGSTQLQRQATDAPWARLLGEHDRRLRACVSRFGGIEFAHTGDGLGAFFSTAAAAAGCALACHESLASLDGAPGGGLPIRVGVCWGEARPRGRDLAGQSIARTVRVMSVGGAGQTIVDSAIATALGTGWELRSAGRPRLKGFEDLREELFTIGRQRLPAPSEMERAQRV